MEEEKIKQQQTEQQQEPQRVEEPKKEENPQREGKLKKHLVDSSNLEWIAYDKKNSELYIQFHSGGLYKYMNVPENIFNGLLSAGSHGRYFWMKIRDKYDYAKLMNK